MRSDPGHGNVGDVMHVRMLLQVYQVFLHHRFAQDSSAAALNDDAVCIGKAAPLNDDAMCRGKAANTRNVLAVWQPSRISLIWCGFEGCQLAALVV